MVLIDINLSLLHPMMLRANFDCNWPCSDFLIAFSIFCYYLLLEKGMIHHFNKLRFPLLWDVLY